MEGDAFDPMQSGSKVRGLGWLGRGCLLFVEARTPTNFTPGKVLAPLMLAESEEIGIGSNQRPPHSVPATPTSVMFKTIKTYQKEQKWIKINEKHEKSIENY